MKIAITGGAGFIGQATMADASRRGHEVWAFDRSKGDDILGDLDGLADASAVIHLAGVLGTAELFDDPWVAINTNISGSFKVMQWCQENGAQYVGILMPDVFPSIYTATKVATARLATALHHSRGLLVNHVRAFNVYGPGQKYGPGHPQKIVPTFAVHAWHRQPLPIWGDGQQVVDLIHVDDIARLLVDAAELPGGDHILDGGVGVPITVKRVAHWVARCAGWEDPQFKHLPMRDGERPTYTMAATGAGWDLLDWVPRNTPDQMLSTVASYEGVPL